MGMGFDMGSPEGVIEGSHRRGSHPPVAVAKVKDPD